MLRKLMTFALSICVAIFCSVGTFGAENDAATGELTEVAYEIGDLIDKDDLLKSGIDLLYFLKSEIGGAWNSPGCSIAIGQDKIIISQTADIHKKVSHLLDSFRKNRGKLIHVEIWFITLGKKFVEKCMNVQSFPRFVTVHKDMGRPNQESPARRHRIPEFYELTKWRNPPLLISYLDDKGGKFLMKLIQTAEGAHVLTGPKFTLRNGQLHETDLPRSTLVTTTIGTPFSDSRRPQRLSLSILPFIRGESDKVTIYLQFRFVDTKLPGRLPGREGEESEIQLRNLTYERLKLELKDGQTCLMGGWTKETVREKKELFGKKIERKTLHLMVMLRCGITSEGKTQKRQL